MLRDLAAKRRDKGRVSMLAHLSELTAYLQGTAASALVWARLIPARSKPLLDAPL